MGRHINGDETPCGPFVSTTKFAERSPVFEELFFSSVVWQDKTVGRVTAPGHDPDYNQYPILFLYGHNVLLTKPKHFKGNIPKTVSRLPNRFRPQALRFVNRAILFGHLKDDPHKPCVRF